MNTKLEALRKIQKQIAAQRKVYLAAPSTEEKIKLNILLGKFQNAWNQIGKK